MYGWDNERIMKLLTTNTKLLKGNYNILGLALMPADHSGRDVCPARTESCTNICVTYFRGMTVMPNVRAAMKARTDYFFDDRPRFYVQLMKEIKNHSKKDNPLIRLNISSDIDQVRLKPELFTDNPKIKFYSYTKVFNRALRYTQGDYPTNAYETYSWNERSNKRAVNELLKNGTNVAVVMDVYYGREGKMDPLPAEIKIGTKIWPVVDGDINDARIPAVDGRGTVVGLRAKIKKSDLQTYIDSGFVITKNKKGKWII